MKNPVLWLELRIRIRPNAKLWVVTCLYLLCLLVISSIAITSAANEGTNADPSETGLTIYSFGIFSLLGLLIILGPLSSAGAISSEREQRTLPALMNTPMSPATIVLGSAYWLPGCSSSGSLSSASLSSHSALSGAPLIPVISSVDWGSQSLPDWFHPPSRWDSPVIFVARLPAISPQALSCFYGSSSGRFLAHYCSRCSTIRTIHSSIIPIIAYGFFYHHPACSPYLLDGN